MEPRLGNEAVREGAGSSGTDGRRLTVTEGFLLEGETATLLGARSDETTIGIDAVGRAAKGSRRPVMTLLARAFGWVGCNTPGTAEVLPS